MLHNLDIWPNNVIKNIVVVVEVLLHHSSDVVLGVLNFSDKINHLFSVESHFISDVLHFVSVLAHVCVDLIFVFDENALNLLDDTDVSVVSVAFQVFVEVSSQNKTVERLHLPVIDIWEGATHETSEEIVFIIQNASLRVHVSDLVFKDVFITLRDISNQEITKYDEQENDNDNKENPDAQNHKLGLVLAHVAKSF